MTARTIPTVVFAAFLALAAAPGLAQDFEKLTKGIEIAFPESKGVLRFPPPCGIPFPEPKTMAMEPGTVALTRDGKIACSIVVSPTASVTEKSAARELSDQIAFLAGTEQGPEIVAAGTPTAAPTQCVLGVDPGLFQGAELDVPQAPEGFAIKAGKWHNGEAALVAGKDRFGVYWGVQTLKQMLYRGEDGRVLAPRGKVADWPDAQYRLAICLQYMLGNDAQTLAYLVRNGRVNATIIHALERSDKDTVKSTIDALHRRGILCFAVISWVKIDQFFRATKNRGICPSADIEFFESLARMALEAGADGISLHFDDMVPADIIHATACPRCGKRFKDAVEAQVYIVRDLLALAKRGGWGDKPFVVCPTLYAGSETDRPAYEQVGLTYKKYYPEFCDFPESANVRFYHCDFTRDALKRLKDMGHKNYVWWNNGPTAGGNVEVWGSASTLSRMGYSWGMFDGRLPKSGDEIFYPEKIAELKYLRGKTDFVFNGTNDLLGQAIGCLFAWDMGRFLACEREFQEWYVNNYYGKDVIGGFRAWEWAVKPLLSKCVKGQPLDENDGLLLKAACLVRDRLPDGIIPKSEMAKTLNTLKNFNDFSARIKETGKVTDRISFRREKGCLFSLGSATLVEDAKGTLSQPTVFQTWKDGSGLKLAGTSFTPTSGDTPAELISSTSKGGSLTMGNLNVDISGFNALAVPCNLSRGTELTVKAVIDGVEHVGTPTMGHAPEWQDLLLPLAGKKLNSISLNLAMGDLDRCPTFCKALLRPVRLERGQAELDTLTVCDEPVGLAGSSGFLLAKNKLALADDRFVLSRRPFSVEVKVCIIKPTGCKLAGTRQTFAGYPGNPGWALGMGSGGFTFTVEDQDKMVSSANGGGWLGRYTPYHVVAVRDFPNHKLRLYVNGAKVAETDEKGSGVFGDERRTLGLSFDPWLGSGMAGLLQYVKVHDRALTENEAKACSAK